jgi:hypothetical protein
MKRSSPLACLVLGWTLLAPPYSTEPCFAQAEPATPVAQIPGIALTGAQGQHAVIDAAQLQTMNRRSVVVRNRQTGVTEDYEGVLLSDLLTRIGAPNQLKGSALANYVVAEGADHYRVVLSLAEVVSSFHPGEVIVADRCDGQPLGEDQGPFKLIVSDDKLPSRWVHNLVSITLAQAK